MPRHRNSRPLIRSALVLLAMCAPVAGARWARAQCPSAPTGVGVVTSGCDRVVNWSYSGPTPFLFKVFRGTGVAAQATQVGFVGGTVRSFTNINVPPPPTGTFWRYYVQAISADIVSCPSGEGPFSAFGSTQVIGVAPPSNVQVFTGNCREVRVTWNFVSGQDVQTIFDTPSGPVIQTTVSSSGSASWNWPGSGGIPTRARVAAIGPCGPGVETVISFTPLIDPFEPTAATATQNQACAVVVSWTPDASHAGGYRIKRLLDGATTDVVDLPAGATQYVDTSGDPDVTYEYRIFGINNCGESNGYRWANGRKAAGSPLVPARSAKATIGGTAVLTMPSPALAGPAATFAWRKGVNPDGTGGVPLVDGGRISGSSTPTLTITGIVAGDEDLYGLTVGQTCYPQTFIASVLLQGGPSACPADFNNSGAVSVQDIFDFLAAWFTGCP